MHSVGVEGFNPASCVWCSCLVSDDPPPLCCALLLMQVGMVFQSYALFNHMTVADNIKFGLQVWPAACAVGCELGGGECPVEMASRQAAVVPDLSQT